MSNSYDDKHNASLWRLAMSTIARTVLAFTLPYLVAYYSVVGVWQGIRLLMQWSGAR